MSSDTQDAGWGFLGERVSGALLPVALIGSLLVLLVPLPATVLDLLLAANLTLAVLVLLTVLSIRTPFEFSAFPTVLLATTLTRLVLNVASTRLILTEGGRKGLNAAGGVIRAFGEFVAGDELIVGVVIFSILIVIQFVVITKGSTRISEVAARFMLDGLPGRQMAIDADLHSGLIDQHEAARRRDAVYRQSDFFGAMDGASKYVRGDAVAGVLITLVNIAGGLCMGVLMQGMELTEALSTFTRLTVGDGLVSQVPAFLISLAAGIIVTRSSAESDLGRDVSRQLLGRPEVLGAASMLLGLLALTGLPRVPLLVLAGGLATGAFMLARRAQTAAEPNSVPDRARVDVDARPSRRMEQQSETLSSADGTESKSDRLDDLLEVEPLGLEIGYRLIALADPSRGGDLLERLRAVRQQLARDLGIIVPQVRIRDEVGQGANEYRVKLRGVPIGQGTAFAGRLLAIPPASLLHRPDGRDGLDPISGKPAVWIHAEGREVAELAGCRLLEASEVIADHFRELVLENVHELISHQQVTAFLERVRASAPGVVDELIPGLLRLGELRRVLQNLVSERVSIRDGETILETLAEQAVKTRDIDRLTERVRQALGRHIVQPYRDEAGRIRAIGLARELSAELGRQMEGGEASPGRVSEETARRLVSQVQAAIAPLIEQSPTPLLVVPAELRSMVRELLRRDLPRLGVVSIAEIPANMPLEMLAVVSWDESGASTGVITAALT